MANVDLAEYREYDGVPELDLAYIELTLQHELRRQGVDNDPNSRLVKALLKTRNLIGRCNGCMRIKGGVA